LTRLIIASAWNPYTYSSMSVSTPPGLNVTLPALRASVTGSPASGKSVDSIRGTAGADVSITK
jgi:hypothetical protein